MYSQLVIIAAVCKIRKLIYIFPVLILVGPPLLGRTVVGKGLMDAYARIFGLDIEVGRDIGSVRSRGGVRT